MKLIIINGPCGIGKSTLAGKVHENIPLSFLLDIDAQRCFISHYRERNEESAKAIQAIANSIVKNCLEIERDIIIDKMTFDPTVIDFYYGIAKEYGADVFEIILWASKEAVMQRANERGWREGGLLTPEKCELFWQRTDELKESRPQAHVIDIERIGEDELYEQVANIVGII